MRFHRRLIVACLFVIACWNASAAPVAEKIHLESIGVSFDALGTWEHENVDPIVQPGIIPPRLVREEEVITTVAPPINPKSLSLAEMAANYCAMMDRLGAHCVRTPFTSSHAVSGFRLGYEMTLPDGPGTTKTIRNSVYFFLNHEKRAIFVQYLAEVSRYNAEVDQTIASSISLDPG